MAMEMATEGIIKDIMKRKAVVKLYLLKEMTPPWPESPKTDGPRGRRPARTSKPVVLQEAETTGRLSARGAAKKAQLAITQVMLSENMSPLEDPNDPEYSEPPEPHLRKWTRRNNAQTAVKKEDKRDGLSEYELERLENIRRNRAFLTSLNIQEAMDDLKEMTRPKKRRSPVRELLPPRKSERLENIKESPREPISSADEPNGPKKKVRGPIPMNAVNLDEGSELPPELMKLFTENSIHDEKVNLDITSYQSTLKSMKLPGDGATRVVNAELISAAFHPATTSLLMAAGNRLGHVGLYNVDSGWEDDGVLLFEPHTGPVTCMAFSRTHPANLLSLAYNGSIRCMDVERRLFDEVYDTESTLKSFDFLSDDCSTLVVGQLHQGLAGLAIVDRRCTRPCQSRHALDSRVMRCVNVHPLHKHYIVVSECRVVRIYDSRSLGKTDNKPVSQLLGHSDAINSSYFSPSTGNRVLTSCKDNKIRVYDTTSMTTTAPLLTTVRIADGRAKTSVGPRAVWDPKKEDCFAVGSLTWPRTMQVYHETGKRLHTFLESDKVLSVAAFHPSRNALLGGVASGHLFVLSD